MHRHLGLVSKERENKKRNNDASDLDKTFSAERVNNRTIGPFTVLAQTY